GHPSQGSGGLEPDGPLQRVCDDRPAHPVGGFPGSGGIGVRSFLSGIYPEAVDQVFGTGTPHGGGEQSAGHEKGKIFGRWHRIGSVFCYFGKMIASLGHPAREYRIDLSRPLDISIALRGGEKNVNAWY